MDLRHIERRGIEPIEVSLIEDNVKSPIPKSAHVHILDSPLHVKELNLLNQLLSLSIKEGHEALSIIDIALSWSDEQRPRSRRSDVPL